MQMKKEAIPDPMEKLISWKTIRLQKSTAMAMRLAMEELRQLQKIRKKKLRQLTVMGIQHCLIQPVQQIY